LRPQNHTNRIFLKKTRNQFKPTGFGLVRFGFLTKTVQTGLARFWLGFFQFGLIFFGSGSVQFGFSVSGL
jgi:hypothetical protein